MILIEVRCAGCDLQLIGEAYTGTPRRLFAPPTAERVAYRAGWRDGLCPDCRPPTA
jgi:hypothetical protein